jgi:chromosome segregation ATPase
MTRSAAATRRVHALEARLSELERRAADTPPLQSLADSVLDRASDVARGLQRHLVSSAEAEREEFRKIAAQESKVAEVRSAEIVAEAKRDHDEVASMMDEARNQVGLFLQQGKAVARERARATWAKAAGVRAELSFELQQLQEQRQSVLSELAQSRESVSASKKLLGENGARPAPRRKPPP